MEIILANPRGFCAGVDRAISIVERALQLFGAPIYVRHEVVHNKAVVGSLVEKGVIFVDEVAQVPKHATLIFSAHGVSKQVQQQAKQCSLRVFDATCPLVTKVHLEVARYAKDGIDCIMIGHKGHPEVEGTLGQYHSAHQSNIYLVESVADIENLPLAAKQPLAYVSQTTLSVDDTQVIIDGLKARFHHVIGPKKDDICYATQSRQDAVKDLAKICDLILVVGSKNSSNSNRLKEVAQAYACNSLLIDSVDELDKNSLQGVKSIGITAGASAPEYLVEQLIEYLISQGGHFSERLKGTAENVYFPLPRELQ